MLDKYKNIDDTTPRVVFVLLRRICIMLEILLFVAIVMLAAVVMMDIRTQKKLEEQNELLREEIRILKYGGDDLHG